MIAEFLFRNPRILALVLAVIAVSGFSSIAVMPRLEDPVLGKRVAIVSTVFPGANARRVESLVTQPLEESLSGISEIRQIRSSSLSGISSIAIELGDSVGADGVDAVWTDVRDRIADNSAQLPKECLPPKFEVFPLKAFAAILALKPGSDGDGETDVFRLRSHSRELRARLNSLAGTEKVEVFGDPGEEYVAEIDPAVLASTGLSIAAIARQVEASHASLPAGRIPLQDRLLALTMDDASDAITRLSDALVTTGPRGETKTLGELARVRRQIVQPASSLALVEGQPVIVLGVLVSDQSQVDDWTIRMHEQIAEFEDEYKGEVTVDALFLQRTLVEHRMVVLLRNLGIGTAAVTLVVLVLMGWRSMIVVAISLPLSALMVLTAMRAMSIPIHQMSITGLIVALGLLIDNAIVIVEDVRSRILAGDRRAIAIAQGIRHLAMPLFGSTLTTALAFLPIATLPGPPGEFVGTIAISVILAISSSFLLSMTVIPALIGIVHFETGGRNRFANGLTVKPIRSLYEITLRAVFRSPLTGVALGFVLPVAGFLAARQIPEQFFPPSDRRQIQIEIERPASDDLEATRATTEQVRQFVASQPEVQRQNWFVGGSAPTFYYNVVPRRRGTPFYAQAFVDLKNEGDTRDLVRRLQRGLDQRIADSRVIVRQLEQGPPFDAPIEIRVSGPNLSTLQRLGSELRLLLCETPDVIQTRSDLQEVIPMVAFDVDKAAAGKRGLDESQLTAQLYTSLEGTSAGSVFENGEEHRVRILLDLRDESKLEQLAALPLRPMAGGLVSAASAPRAGPAATRENPTLAGLAERRLDSDVGAVVRINGHRTNEVKAYITAGVLPSTVIDDFRVLLEASEFVLPEGYTLQFGGETEKRTEAVDNLIANAVILFALMVLTLVVSFGSFRCAAVVASVGGLSIGLGPLMLSTFGYPFGFMAIVGTMGLVGVAINDSIVVLAAIRAEKAACDGDVDELVRVVVQSTRHVVATTVTTVVGFTPLILGGGGFWPPLAITIAGGVGGATFLALYYVPSLHLLLTRTRPSKSPAADASIP